MHRRRSGTVLLNRLYRRWVCGLPVLVFFAALLSRLCAILVTALRLLSETSPLLQAFLYDPTKHVNLACESFDLMLQLVHLPALLGECTCVGIAKRAQLDQKLLVFR